MKKIYKILLVFLLLSAVFAVPFGKKACAAKESDKIIYYKDAETYYQNVGKANEENGISVYNAEGEKTVEEQLKDNVYEQLEKLDTNLFDSFIAGLDDDTYQMFGNKNFTDTVKGVLNGEFNTDVSNVFTMILNIFLKSFLNIAPIMVTIGMIAILSGTLNNMQSGFLNKGGGETVHYVCYLAIVLVIATAIMQVINLTSGVIENMRTFMSLIFPLILTLITASGGASGGKLFQPLTAVLTNGITEIIISVVFPIFIVITVLSIVSNLSNNIKLNKLADFFKSAGQWIMGICFTVFIAFLSIQGILAGAMDGISIRAAKYAIGHSIPIVGNYIKDGFDLVLGSCVLIKNAAGVTGMLLLLAIVITPIIQILVFSLSLRLTAGIVEPVTDKRISTLIQSVSKNITLLLVAIISIAFMFFVTLAVLIMSSNSVLL